MIVMRSAPVFYTTQRHGVVVLEGEINVLDSKVALHSIQMLATAVRHVHEPSCSSSAARSLHCYRLSRSFVAVNTSLQCTSVAP